MRVESSGEFWSSDILTGSPTDYDMAQSIQRVLGTGEMLEHDKILFPHEYLESKYMNHGFDQRRAHELANLDYNYEDALNQWLESEK